MRFRIKYGNRFSNKLFKDLIKFLIAISFCCMGVCFASSQLLPSLTEVSYVQENHKNKTTDILSAKLDNKLNNKFLSNSMQVSDKRNAEEVGSLSGKLEVNEAGAAIYNVPINVPPGTAGMTPKLSITYNSNQKNGLLGMGFSLQGLTSIVRAPQNKAENGQIHGVDFTDQDRFSFGGQQLVAIKGDYGQDQAEYRTYIDSQSKIISYGRQGNGPQSFKVWTKGGQIAEYGVSEDSRLKAHIEDPQGKILDDQTVKQWTLDKIEDTAGNYLQIHYFKDEANGVFYPTEIDYTGNDAAGIKPYNKVEFVYADRPDARTLYYAGSKSVLNKRLSEIKIYSGDQTGSYKLVYDYQLTYEISPNTYRSRLTSIKLSDANGNYYPATTFNWQTNDEGWEKVPQYTPPVEIASQITKCGLDAGVRFVDLNGNGLLDIVKSAGWTGGPWPKYGAWINTGSGWKNVSDKYKLPVEITDFNTRDGSVDAGVRFIDLNGNGIQDVVKLASWTQDPSPKDGAWINTGDGWENVSSKYKLPVEITSQITIWGLDAGVRFIDLNGNGLLDLVKGAGWTGGPWPKYGAWINAYNGWSNVTNKYSPPVEITASLGQFGLDAGVRFVDLNGNGLLDIVKSAGWTERPKYGAWINTGSSWKNVSDKYKLPVEITDHNTPDGSVDAGVRFIDLNGNGIQDVVKLASWTGDPSPKEGAWINMGTGWKDVSKEYTPPVEIASQITKCGLDAGVRFVDLNGSGLLDIVKSAGWTGGHWPKYGAWINTGSSWKNVSDKYKLPVEITDHNTPDGSVDAGVRFIDLNGNGIQDVVKLASWTGDPSPKEGAWLNKAKKLPDYLIGITNGLGEKTSIDYEPLSGTNVKVYDQEKDDQGKLISQYPNPQLDAPMYVVYQTSSDAAISDPHTLSKLARENENYPTNHSLQSKYSTVPNYADPNQHITTYHYTGARVNKLGWGFLGFHQVSIKDESTGITKTTTYSQDADKHLQSQVLSTVTQTAAGRTLTDNNLLWEVKQYGDGSLNHTYFLPYVSNETDNHYALNNGSLISTKVTKTQLDDYGNAVDIDETISGTTGDYETHTQNTYKNDPDKWYLGELTKTVVTKSSPDNAAIIRTSSFKYDEATGMLKQTVIEPDDANYILTKDFERDKFGNLIKTTISGKDIDARIHSVTYDEEGRFVLTKTNTLNQTVSQTIDPRFGEPLTITDLNGLVTKYEYDGFGRKTRITNPEGTVTTQVYNWSNPDANRINANETNEINETNEVDESDEIKGITDYTKIQTGNCKNSKLSEVGYGMENQPIKAVYSITTHTDGGTTDTAYYDQLGRNVASTTQGFDGRIIWKDTFYDDLGRVIQQSVPYFGDSFSSLSKTKTKDAKKIRMSCGEIIGDQAYYTRFKYDVLGRIIETTNPDDSVIKVNYDGLTTTTINPLKQQVIKKANVTGKIIEAIDNNGCQTNYKYDSYGNLVWMYEGKSNVSTITYDKLGRKIAINDPDKGNWSYKYDVLGELTSQTNANGDTTTFKYDKLGRMISRTDKGGTSGWTYGTDKSQHNVGKLIKAEGISNNGQRPDASQVLKAARDGIGNYTRTIIYNSLSLPEYITISIDNSSTYTTTTALGYDRLGRLLTTVYPENVKVKNDYNALGYLEKKENADTGQIYWQLNAMDAAGHVISETHSNGLITTKTYDPRTGFLLNIQTKLSQALALQKKLLPGITKIKKINRNAKNNNQHSKTKEPIQTQANDTTIVQNLQYSYDSLGNVQTRDNNVTKTAENFSYDNLNRLTAWNANGKIQASYKYDAFGNIIYKSDVGTYTYGEGANGAPHAVTSIKSIDGKIYHYKYDKSGNQISGQVKDVNRTITYTSYDKPNQLTDETHNTTTNYVYDPDRTRFARISNSGNISGGIISTRTYFLGDYQLEVHNDKGNITISNKYYVAPGTLYINKTDVSGKSLSKDTYTLLKDNLGSLTAITTSNADVLQRFSYDPYGKQTQIEGKHLDNPITHEGFTGHENIEGMNLIHTNGRLYDPILGRFLSADPNVQDPTNSQSLNRYSYCLNNPLAYIDPTGFFSFKHLFHDIGHAIHDIFQNQYVRMAISIVIGFLPGVNWIGIALYESMFNMVLATAYGASTHDVLRTGLITFGTAVVWNEVGGFLKGAQYLERVAVHGLVGGGLQVAEGGNFKDGFLSAAAAEALPINSIGGKNTDDLTPEIIAERTAAAAIVGGTVAAATGGNFTNGAKTAAFAELFNDCAHPGGDSKSESLLEKAEDLLEEGADDFDELGNKLMPLDGVGEFPKIGAEGLKLTDEGLKALPEALKVTEDVGKITIEKISTWAKGFLGEDARVITNKAGDKVFVNSENTRRIRFDINRTYPHENPHVHIEEYDGKVWKGSRVYPKDVNPY